MEIKSEDLSFDIIVGKLYEFVPGIASKLGEVDSLNYGTQFLVLTPLIVELIDDSGNSISYEVLNNILQFLNIMALSSDPSIQSLVDDVCLGIHSRGEKYISIAKQHFTIELIKIFDENVRLWNPGYGK